MLDNDYIKMRAQLKASITEVKILMSHPMETGRRKNDLDEVVPAHFIQRVVLRLNGAEVLEAHWGTGISKNPYLTCYLASAKLGDSIEVEWFDNTGATSHGEIKVTQG